MGKIQTDKRTPWTDILLAQRGNSEVRLHCLERLAEQYFDVVKSYVERFISPREVNIIEDLVQDFFHKFLAKNLLDHLDRERGSLRGFLFISVRSFVNDMRDKAKHGKGDTPFTQTTALHIAESIPDPQATEPETVFMRSWANKLMSDTLEAFRLECLERGKGHYFEVFEHHVLKTGETGTATYAETAASLGMDEKQVANTLHRAKKGFNKMLVAMVKATVADESLVEQELLDLRKFYK